MAVLEPVEVDKRSADRALALCNDKSLVKFDQLLRVQQVKQGTRSTYYWQLLRLKHNLPKPEIELDNISERDLLTAMAKVSDTAKGSGYQTFALSVKRFYSTMGREELAKKLKVPRRPTGLPDILNQQQIKALIQEASGPDGNLRNRLIVELLWETGCRIGELTSLKVKDIQFDQYSAIIHLTGKTGERRVRAFACKPDLLEYLNNHPFKNNPNEYFFLSSLGPAGHFHRLTDQGVRQFLWKLGTKVLNKRIHPHTFRHSRATELSRVLTDRELKVFGGWKRTNMLEIYSHLSGKDVDDKMLALHGFKVNQDDVAETLAVKVCRQSDCKAENSPMAIYCQKCGHPLASDSTEDLLKDPKFIAGLAENREFIDALKKALESG
jgi:integrase/recombinase XerD